MKVWKVGDCTELVLLHPGMQALPGLWYTKHIKWNTSDFTVAYEDVFDVCVCGGGGAGVGWYIGRKGEA